MQERDHIINASNCFYAEGRLNTTGLDSSVINDFAIEITTAKEKWRGRDT